VTASSLAYRNGFPGSRALPIVELMNSIPGIPIRYQVIPWISVSPHAAALVFAGKPTTTVQRRPHAPHSEPTTKVISQLCQHDRMPRVDAEIDTIRCSDRGSNAPPKCNRMSFPSHASALLNEITLGTSGRPVGYIFGIHCPVDLSKTRQSLSSTTRFDHVNGSRITHQNR
jgi:hypothetical protein